MTENILTDDNEVVDLFGEKVEPPAPEEDFEYHSILEVWKAYLDPAEGAVNTPPTMDWVAIVMTNWSHIIKDFSQLKAVQKHYFRIILDAKAVLDDLIEGDPECYDVSTAAEDAERNKEHYRHMLLHWQKVLLVEQSKWDINDPEAAEIFVALGEVQNQLLGKDGLANFLGVISLPWTEEEQSELSQELFEFRKELGI